MRGRAEVPKFRMRRTGRHTEADTDGHGLYPVRQLAVHLGYPRGPAGTTVWSHRGAGRPDG